MSAPPVGALTTEDDFEDVDNGRGVAAMSVFVQAKKLVADGLHVPLSAVEIIVRA